jgi:diacylglycerol kinase
MRDAGLKCNLVAAILLLIGAFALHPTHAEFTIMVGVSVCLMSLARIELKLS